MHEMSLVQGLIMQLRSLAQEHHKEKVLRVTMEIGCVSGVVSDSFQFAFEVLAAEDELTRGASLVIETPPVVYRCFSCGLQVLTPERPQSCERCLETLLSPEGGDELILRQVEME